MKPAPSKALEYSATISPHGCYRFQIYPDDKIVVIAPSWDESIPCSSILLQVTAASRERRLESLKDFCGAHDLAFEQRKWVFFELTHHHGLGAQFQAYPRRVTYVQRGFWRPRYQEFERWVGNKEEAAIDALAEANGLESVTATYDRLRIFFGKEPEAIAMLSDWSGQKREGIAYLEKMEHETRELDHLVPFVGEPDTSYYYGVSLGPDHQATYYHARGTRSLRDSLTHFARIAAANSTDISVWYYDPRHTAGKSPASSPC